MLKIVNAQQMRDIDRLTTERFATPSILLMEQAAAAAARAISAKFNHDLKDKWVTIFCGKGNNGGDGAALARSLCNFGAKVVNVCLIGGSVNDTKDDARTNFEIISRVGKSEDDSPKRTSPLSFHGIQEYPIWEDTKWASILGADIIVDALFGTGLTRPLEGLPLQAVSFLKRAREKRQSSRWSRNPLIVSLDIPSGLNADSSEPIGDHITADLTITFTAPKPANVLPPASRANGELVVADIGSPQKLIDEAPSQLFLIERTDAQKWLVKTRYLPGSYKNTHGHALIVAGSRDMTGAAVLSSDSAMRSGAGLVTVATPQSALDSVAARAMPEVMAAGLAETENGAVSHEAWEKFEELAKRANIVAVGCGLSSKDESTKRFVHEVVMKRMLPTVVDADGLNSLAPLADDIQGTPAAPLVFTPHIGEFRRLLGDENKSALESYDERIEAARAFASKHKLILVLKGERTLIAAPDGRVMINPTGGAELGTGGSGDTLTGLITGFLAQTFGRLKDEEKKDLTEHTIEAVVAAVYVGGLAGHIAAESLGMRAVTASDIREHFRAAIRALDPEGEKPRNKG